MSFTEGFVMAKLTTGQITVLRAAAKETGVSKANASGRYWRNFDQLEMRGLIERRGIVYVVTDAGLDALRIVDNKPRDDGTWIEPGHEPGGKGDA